MASKSSAPVPHSAAGQQRPRTTVEDRIDELFATFELMYNSQFRNAYGDTERLRYGKQLWYQQLREIDPDCLGRAIQRTVAQCKFLPTVRELLDNCRRELGMPEPLAAWQEVLEAAPYPQYHSWSHAAVYHTMDVMAPMLQRNSLRRTEDDFLRAYNETCERIMRGESLKLPEPTEAESNKPRPRLRQVQRQKNLRQIAELQKLLR